MLGSRKKDLFNGIRDLDIIVEGRSLFDDERWRKEEISRDLEKLIFLK